MSVMQYIWCFAKGGGFQYKDTCLPESPERIERAFRAEHFLNSAQLLFFLLHNGVDFEKKNAAYLRVIPMLCLDLTYSYSYLLEFVEVVETMAISHCFISALESHKLTN